MAKRKLLILRRVKRIPVLGVCEACNMQFPLRQPWASGPSEAQAAIQQQFNAHKCGPLPAAPAAGG